MRSKTSYRAQWEASVRLEGACEIGKSDSETLYAPDLGASFGSTAC